MDEITLRPFEVLVRHRFAYVAVWHRGSWWVGKATENVPGFQLTTFGPWSAGEEKFARRMATKLNRTIALDEKTAAIIVGTTMRTGVRKEG